MALNTENLRTVFAEEGKFDSFKKITHSLVHGEDLFEYDDNGVEKRVSKSSANKAVQKVFMDICGLTENDLKSKKTRHRAEKAHAPEIFAIVEEEIDFKISQGFDASEWFNEFVEYHNLALGDGLQFNINNERTLFEILDYSGDNHDLTMQQVPERGFIQVKTSPKAVKIGKDIDLIILGRVDFASWVQKVADSFVANAFKVIAVPFGIAGHVNPLTGFVVICAKYVVLLLSHLLNLTLYPACSFKVAVNVATCAP